MLYYNFFSSVPPIPISGVDPFPAVTLQDQIRTCIETGIVLESVPVAISYDDESGDYDPQSNIRESRLDLFEYGMMDATARVAATDAAAAAAAAAPAPAEPAATTTTTTTTES